MKAKDLIEALKALNPEAEVFINIKQFNKLYGKQIKISYGHLPTTDNPSYNKSVYLNEWVNGEYGGSITVHLPNKAIISNWPKDVI